MLKRVISVFLCAVLLLNLVYPRGVLAATTADTEILVEDFETTELNTNGIPAGWQGTAQDDTTYSLASSDKYLQQVKSDAATSTRTIYWEKDIPIEAGKTYRATIDYTGTVNCQFYVQTFTNNYGSVDSQNKGGKSDSEGTWTTLTNEIVTSGAAAKVRITIGLGGANTGTVGYDDIKLVEVASDGTETVVYEETFETAELNTNGIPTGWQGSKKDDTTWSLESNGKYLQLTKDTSATKTRTIYIEKAFQVQAGKTYRANLDYSGTVNCQFYVTTFDGSTQKDIQNVPGMTEAYGEWTRLTNEIIASADATKIRITIGLGGSNTGTVGFDNLVLVEVGEEIPEEPVTEIQNPSFEILPESGNSIPGWTTQCDMAYITQSTEQYSHGSYALKMADPDANTGLNVTSSKIDVTPGAHYVATMDYYGTAQCQVYVRFFDADGNILDSKGSTAQKDKEQWYSLKAEGTAPIDATHAAVVLATTRGGSGTVWFDNITLTMSTSIDSSGGSVSNEVPEGGWTLKETSHPRLYFNRAELAELKAYAADTTVNAFGYSGAETYADLLADAEKYAAETSMSMTFSNRTVVFDLTNLQDPNTITELQTPPEGFNGLYYPYFSNYGAALQTRMQVLSLAYAISGNQKYATKAIQYAMDMTEWELWAEKIHDIQGFGENSCLDTAYFVIGTSTVYDICYDLLSEEQRTTLRNAIITKGLDKIYNDCDVLTNHNYYLTRISALLTGTCAVAGETDKTADYLTRAYRYAEWYLEELYTSGDQEGYLYSSHQLEYLIEGMDNLVRVTGNEDLLTHNYFTDLLVDWVVYFMVPGDGGLLPISDTNFTTYFFKTMSVLNKKQDNAKAGYYLKYSGAKGDPFETLLFTSSDPVIADAETLDETVVHVEEIGYGALRTGWEASDMLLSLIANDSTMSHNHYDQNSFTLSTDGKLLASDVGYADNSGGDKTTFDKTYGHSTIWVDGETQSVKGTGSMTKELDSDLYGYLIGSAPGAYDVVAGKNVVNKFDRHAILVNHEDEPYYVLIDDLNSDTERVFGWNLYTGGWDVLEIDGKKLDVGSSAKGNHAAISSTGGVLHVEFAGDDQLTMKADKYLGYGPTLLAQDVAATDYQFMSVLSIGDAADLGQTISVSDMLNDPAVKWQTSSDRTDITKIVTVESNPCLFFRAAEVNDYIEFPFTVEKDGTYEVVLKLAQASVYGQYQVYLDGTAVGEVYDGYANTSAGKMASHSVGQQTMTAGEHTLKLELVGKNDASTGVLISCSTIVLDTGNGLGESAVQITESYDTDSVLGAKIAYNAAKSDIVLFNRGTETVSAGDVQTDAKQASVLGVGNGVITEGFTATDATSVLYGATTLLAADSPVSVVADYRSGVTYEVSTETEQTVKLYAGQNISNVMVNGQSANYTVEGEMLVVTLTAGAHTINANATPSSAETVIELSGISYEYDGIAKEPTVTVKINGAVVSTEEYSVTYTDNTDAGTATVTVTDNSGGNYFVSGTATFTITAKALDDATIELSQDSYDYDGTAKEPSVTVTLNEKELETGVDYTVSYSNNTEVGTATVTVTGTGNYSGETSATFVIEAPYSQPTVSHGSGVSNSEVNAKLSFADVFENDWFYDSVSYVVSEGLMNGVSTTHFNPDGTTTRAMIVTILWRLEGEPKTNESNFTDVAKRDWFAEAVAWASAEGIVNGMSKTEFAPNQSITREQLAAMLFRYAKYKGYDTSASADLFQYEDMDQVSDYAEEAMAWAVAEGLITGMSDTVLNPAGTATRAQVSVILTRFCKKYA